MVHDSRLDSTFEALIFDWDGTAVPDRASSAATIRRQVEALCSVGVHVFVVSGTHLGNVDGQLRARPSGPGVLHLCLNRGSEVFVVDRRGVQVAWRRTASPEEESSLDRAAAGAVKALARRGVEACIVSDRLNRRKIDLIHSPEWAEPPKALMAELLAAVGSRLEAAGVAGLAEVVDMAMAAAARAGLRDARITSDVKHVEIGLTDKSDSARWAASWLAARGITGRLVLVAGDEFGVVGGVPGSDSLMLVPELARAPAVSVGVEPGELSGRVMHIAGGPQRFGRLLADQLDRRAGRRVPTIDPDPRWVVELPADHVGSRVAEALGTLSNGWAGLRAQREEEGGSGIAPFTVSGIYTGGASPALVPGPVWTTLLADAPTPDRRWVDMRTGVLLRRAHSLRSLRFLSGAAHHTMALRAEAPSGHLAVGPLKAPDPTTPVDLHDGQRGKGLRTRSDRGSVAVVTHDTVITDQDRVCVERLAAWAASDSGRVGWAEPTRHLARLRRSGFDSALADHRKSWADRWETAGVDIEGAPQDELAARYAIFQLLSAAPSAGEAAVGARGLTGPAYGGHVFWDTDVFVLPALAALAPAAARAVLTYRLARLPAARAAAARRGSAGVRFPWESAADGTDVTPRRAPGPNGREAIIRTGEFEEHITADVAWAVAEYSAWTGDAEFLAGPGSQVVQDTARYWAARARRTKDNKAHIYGVMGPDEYHEVVDDNAFTNLMARWNLRTAADLPGGPLGPSAAERRRWRRLAAQMVDGYCPASGVYEQFAGYFGLEPLLVSQIGGPPMAADVLLGPDRLQRTQVIKQADVLMAHLMIPGEVMPGSLAANLRFYEPRTAHGSSLSPAVHSALLARAREPEAALELFRMAARLDLDDLTGTTAAGLHLATFGGLWQALVCGFAGVRPHPGSIALEVDPCLPSDWQSLTLRLQFRGSPIAVRIERAGTGITCSQPLTVRLGDGRTQEVLPPGGLLDTAGVRP